jgi:trehalose 2-sulfotransferase
MKSIQPPSNLQKSYIICSTGRSGSTLLCKTLEKSSFCGHPDEFFHHKLIKPIQKSKDPDYFIDYCNSIYEKGLTSNGIFGIKMHWWQLFDFLKLARQISIFANKRDVEILNSIFPNLKFIYIWRRDMSKQAISTVIALQTKQWVNPTENQGEREEILSTTDNNVRFQPLNIYKWEQSFEDQNRRWRNFFQDNALPYYEIVYEDFIPSFDRKMEEVIDYLEVDRSLLSDKFEMAIKKQGNDINKQFLQRYQAIPKPLLKIIYKLKGK